MILGTESQEPLFQANRQKQGINNLYRKVYITIIRLNESTGRAPSSQSPDVPQLKESDKKRSVAEAF